MNFDGESREYNIHIHGGLHRDMLVAYSPEM